METKTKSHKSNTSSFFFFFFGRVAHLWSKKDLGLIKKFKRIENKQSVVQLYFVLKK